MSTVEFQFQLYDQLWYVAGEQRNDGYQAKCYPNTRFQW